MPSPATDEGRQTETIMNNLSNPSWYAQPWWQAFPNNPLPSQGEAVTGFVSPGHIQSQDEDDDVRETDGSPQYGLDGLTGEEPHHLNPVAASTLSVNGHPDTAPPMELVGHSIDCKVQDYWLLIYYYAYFQFVQPSLTIYFFQLLGAVVVILSGYAIHANDDVWGASKHEILMTWTRSWTKLMSRARIRSRFKTRCQHQLVQQLILTMYARFNPTHFVA